MGKYGFVKLRWAFSKRSPTQQLCLIFNGLFFFYLEILGRVRHPIDRVYFRPALGPLSAQGTAAYVLKCIEACWHEEPEQRPDIRFVRVRLKEMQQGLLVLTNWKVVEILYCCNQKSL